MYTILGDDYNDNTTATDNTITNVATLNMAALLTGNVMTAANTVHDSVINTINQLNANQAALLQQMAALSLNNQYTQPITQITVPVPPMQQLAIPMQVRYTGAATQNTFNVGRGGQGRQGVNNAQGGRASRGRGRDQRTSFANHMSSQAQGGGGQGGCGNGGSIPIAPGDAGTVSQPAT
jgi:hypothetical protein